MLDAGKLSCRGTGPGMQAQHHLTGPEATRHRPEDHSHSALPGSRDGGRGGFNQWEQETRATDQRAETSGARNASVRGANRGDGWEVPGLGRAAQSDDPGAQLRAGLPALPSGCRRTAGAGHRWGEARVGCAVDQPCPTLCDPMGCSMPGFPILHRLPEPAQTHIH